MNLTSGHRSTIADDLTAARNRAFVGRREELTAFRAALSGAADGRPVHYLHGPGGIGKSMLLHRFAEESRSAGRTVIAIDCRSIAPKPEHFLAVARTALTEPDAVLLVDTFERCQGLQGWFWEEFLPQLPVGVVVAVAGRIPPDPRWSLDPGWAELLRVTRLKNLGAEDVVEFLRSRGVPDRLQQAVLTLTGGNPLSLMLAAALAVRDESITTGWKPGQDAVTVLLPRLTGDTPSARHRTALEVCAHAHVTSESLLRAVLGEDAPELFSWLREQPFIESSEAGLFPHDAVREILDADLRWRDPDGFADLHDRMRDYFLARLRSAPDAGLLQATGDLIYLYRRDGSMSRFHDWNGAGYAEELPFAPAHRQEILRLARAAEGGESAAIVGYWLDRRPECFRVYRATRTGRIVAFSAWLRLEHTDDEQMEGAEADPVVAAAWRHARSTGPLRAGEHLAVARFLISEDRYHRPSAPMTLIQWRFTGEMVRANRLAWSYVVVRDDGYWNGHLADVAMTPAAESPRVGDRPYAMFTHDWRIQPPELWLREKSAAMLTGRMMPAAQPSHDGDLAVLSRPDFDAAVRDALRALRRPHALADSPLHRSRLVREGGQDLRQVLLGAVESLRHERGGDKRHRALVATYVKGAPTQEAAATRLGVPFSTYRRHLTSAIDAVCDHLWRCELQGFGAVTALAQPATDAA